MNVTQYKIAAPATVRLPSLAQKFLDRATMTIAEWEQWDHERRFLGQLVVAMEQGHHDKVVQVSGIITPETFVFDMHSTCYNLFLEWQRSGEAWDALRIIETAWPEGGLTYFSHVIDVLGQIGSLLEDTMRILYERQRKRDHHAVIVEHEKRKESKQYTSEQLQAQLAAALREWEDADRLGQGTNIREEMYNLICDLETQLVENKAPSYTKTGIVELDETISGLMPSDYVILAGRPGSGKTSLATNITENICARGGAVVFFSLEMTTKQVIARILQQMTGVSAEWIMTGDPRLRNHLPRLAHASGIVADWKIKVFDHAALADVDCCPALLEQAKHELRVEKIDLAVFDHIGEATKGAVDKQAETTRKSGILRDLAKATEVPVICLVQMNREIEKGGRDEDGFLKRLPQTSDLRDAGEIEEQASKVIFTHNKNQLVLRKNRFGVSEAEIACAFVGEKTRWGTR